MEKICKFV